MTTHLRGPSILFAIGVGLANASGVANAIPENPRVTYEVSGPAVAEYISYQSDNGQQRAVNAEGGCDALALLRVDDQVGVVEARQPIGEQDGVVREER